MTLTDFLLARIAEDESIGRDWRHHPGKVQIHGGGTGYEAIVDPARALAECEAKRRIVDWVFENAATIDGEWGCCHPPPEIRARECPYIGDDDETLLPLRLLALPYADHPDYREEWKP